MSKDPIEIVASMNVEKSVPVLKAQLDLQIFDFYIWNIRKFHENNFTFIIQKLSLKYPEIRNDLLELFQFLESNSNSFKHKPYERYLKKITGVIFKGINFKNSNNPRFLLENCYKIPFILNCKFQLLKCLEGKYIIKKFGCGEINLSFLQISNDELTFLYLKENKFEIKLDQDVAKKYSCGHDISNLHPKNTCNINNLDLYDIDNYNARQITPQEMPQICPNCRRTNSMIYCKMCKFGICIICCNIYGHHTATIYCSNCFYIAPLNLFCSNQSEYQTNSSPISNRNQNFKISSHHGNSLNKITPKPNFPNQNIPQNISELKPKTNYEIQKTGNNNDFQFPKVKKNCQTCEETSINSKFPIFYCHDCKDLKFAKKIIYPSNLQGKTEIQNNKAKHGHAYCKKLDTVQRSNLDFCGSCHNILFSKIEIPNILNK